MTRPLARILGVGARAPVGMNALQVAMGVRARRLEPVSTSFVDSRGSSVGLCMVGGLPEQVHGFERLVALGAPALREAWQSAGGPASPVARAPIPMLLALPQTDRPDNDARLDGDLAPALAAAAGIPFDRGRSRVVREGHAGGAFAMEMALRLLAEGAESVLLGGVDSHVHPEVLAWLDSEHRLHSGRTENGILPGEGAAFLLLGPGSPRRTDRASAAMAHVLAARSGREETVTSGEPNIAAAMTRVVHEVTSAAGEPLIAWVQNDINGERHRIREWVMVELRARLAEGALAARPAYDLGDIGAASGPMFAALACSSWAADCAPASRTLVALHSDGTGRGAFVLGAAEGVSARAPARAAEGSSGRGAP